MACRFPCPSEDEIVRVLHELWSEWDLFGLQLKVPKWKLESIKEDVSGVNRRFVEVITWWIRNTKVANHQKWSTLADAVNNLRGHRNLEDELREMDKALHDYLKGHTPMKQPCTQSDEQVPQVEGSGQETLIPVEEKFLELVEEMQYLLKDTSIKNDTDTETVPMTMHCCGCDRPCIDPFKLNKEGCPNIIKRTVRVMKTTLVTQNAIRSSAMMKVDLDYHTEIAKDIQKLYGRFITDTNRSFKRRGVKISDLTLFLPKSFRSMQLQKDKLEEAKFMEDVFRLLPDEWYKYDEIEEMISCWGDDKDKQRLKVYKDCVEEYSQRKLLNVVMCITVGSGAKPKEGELVTVKVIHEKQTLHEPDMLPCWLYQTQTQTQTQ